MASKATEVELNDEFFDRIGKSPAVTALVREKAARVMSHAKAAAPVDTEAYRDGIQLRMKTARYRNVAMVVGTDWKTLLVESKTGNLARALKQVN